MRIVVDTNIIVSAFLWGGTPRRLLDAVEAPELRDPKDIHVLACALAARVEAIVSGDDDLRVLGSYRGISVLSPTDCLRRVTT